MKDCNCGLEIDEENEDKERRAKIPGTRFIDFKMVK
jgi:hypothetical protein